jgi:hypothetical protein
MLTKRSTLIGLALGLAIALASLAAVAIDAAGGGTTGEQALLAEPLDSIPLQGFAGIPAAMRQGLAEAATDAGGDGAEMFVAGFATGGDQTAAVVGSETRSGVPIFATVAGSGHSGFAPVGEVLKGKPLLTLTGTGGTATTVKEVSVVGIVAPDVAAVSVKRRDGTEQNIPLTRWPDSGFASFAVVSDDAALFPDRVLAYGTSGQLADTEQIDTSPLCSPTKPNCIDY